MTTTSLRPNDDPTGQKRLIGNLASSWVANGIHLVSGFILPRLISDRIGQTQLGIWDFGWAVVSYFALLQGGIVSSVNRYVSQHRSGGDVEGLNVSVNSVNCVLKAIAALMAVLSVVLAWWLPHAMGDKISGFTSEARYVVLFLGFTAAVQVQGAVYGGVLTGCHSWTIQNGIKSVTAILAIVISVMVLLLGGGITSLAVVMLASELALRAAQRVAARRTCPELVMSWRYFSRQRAREMVHFGGKSYVNYISQLLVNQTSSIIVASTFGVAALAVFTRPRTLVRAFAGLIESNALVMVPTVSALQAAGKMDEIARFAAAGARYSAFACLPVLFLLVTLGGDVMRAWMGPGYDDAWLLGIFAVSALLQAIYIPLYRALMGLNQHGRLGLMNAVAAVVTVGAVAAAATTSAGNLRLLALALCVPSVLVNAVLLPALAARHLGISSGRMLISIWKLPLLCAAPSGLAFAAVAFFMQGSPFERLSIGMLAGAALSGWPYWRYMVPHSVKATIRQARMRYRPAREQHSAPTAERAEMVSDVIGPGK